MKKNGLKSILILVFAVLFAILVAVLLYSAFLISTRHKSTSSQTGISDQIINSSNVYSLHINILGNNSNFVTVEIAELIGICTFQHACETPPFYYKGVNGRPSKFADNEYSYKDSFDLFIVLKSKEIEVGKIYKNENVEFKVNAVDPSIVPYLTDGPQYCKKDTDCVLTDFLCKKDVHNEYFLYLETYGCESPCNSDEEANVVDQHCCKRVFTSSPKCIDNSCSIDSKVTNNCRIEEFL